MLHSVVVSYDGDGLVPIHERAQYQDQGAAGRVAGVAGMAARCSVGVPVEIKGSWAAANDDAMDEEATGEQREAGRRWRTDYPSRAITS